MPGNTEQGGYQRKKLRIAFRIIKDNVQNARIQKRKQETKKWNSGVIDVETGREITLLYKDASLWLTEEAMLCMYVFSTWKNLGTYPFGGGWAEQPVWITHALSVLNEEQNRWEKKSA